MDPDFAFARLDAVLDAWLTPPPAVAHDVRAGGRLPEPVTVALRLPRTPLPSLPPRDDHPAWGAGAEAFATVWEGDGPTVVLVHGWGGSAGIWSLWTGLLLRSGMRVVAIDAPAHGASPGARASAPAIAGTLRAASKAVGPFDGAVAHSLGAIAATLAVADGEPLRALVNLAACVHVDGTLRKTAEEHDLPAEAWGALRSRLQERFGDDIALTTAMSRVPDPPRTLFLHDPADPVMPYEEVVGAAKLWSDSECLAVTGVGHERILMSRSALQAGLSHLERALAQHP
ncbi:MAG: alpha/beta fold hydrolase [Armatimonadota bacterium]